MSDLTISLGFKILSHDYLCISRPSALSSMMPDLTISAGMIPPPSLPIFKVKIVNPYSFSCKIFLHCNTRFCPFHPNSMK